MDTTILGVIIGNRGFFPDHLCQSGREQILRVLEEEKITPVVKKALLDAYEQKRFCGGRGDNYEEGPFVYLNRPESEAFSHFHGREDVWLWDERGVNRVGGYKYFGRSMI